MILCLLLAACRRQGAQGPTLQPTPTTTPRSTPLPLLEPTLAPGSDDNPIRMTFLRPGGTTRETEVTRAAEGVATALLEETGLTVEVEVVERDADSVAELCDVDGEPHVAWVTGLGYAAATAQGCGVPVLIVERGTGDNLSIGETVQIIVNDEWEASDVGGLAGATFCRLSYDDMYTWLVPTLMLRAGGVTDTPDAVDTEDIEALIQAVGEGEDCSAAGLTAADFENFGGDVDSARALNRTVAIPYAVLMYPSELPLDERTRLIDGLLDMAESDDLETLLGQDGLAQVDNGALDDFDRFLQSTGVDFAQLGS